MNLHLLYMDIHPVPDAATESLQILQTCDGIAANGIKVSLVTPAPTVTAQQILGRAPDPLLSFAPLSPPLVSRLFHRSSRWFYRGCVAYARQSSVDAILVRNLKLAEALLVSGISIPIFFETHEVAARTYAEDHVAPGWVQRRKLNALRQREGLVYRQCTGLIAKTRLLLEDALGDYASTAPGLVLPNGVDMFLADAARVPRPANPHMQALYLGSLHPWKGVGTALRALLKVPDIRLRIAGGTPERIVELTRLAQELGIAERVEFLGPIDPRRRFELINQVDICLLPLEDASIGARYTSPLKVFEYQAMGKPIITADLPAIHEILVDGQNALLVKPGDSDALADALCKLAADPGMVAALGRNALAASRDCSWKSRGQALIEFITDNLQRAEY